MKAICRCGGEWECSERQGNKQPEPIRCKKCGSTDSRRMVKSMVISASQDMVEMTLGQMKTWGLLEEHVRKHTKENLENLREKAQRDLQGLDINNHVAIQGLNQRILQIDTFDLDAYVKEFVSKIEAEPIGAK